MTIESKRIVVVGGGIIGLTTALALLEAGCKNVRVVAASFESTTSHGAGAVWMPFALPAHMSPYNTLRWCTVGFKWLDEINSKHGEEAGIHEISGVEVDMEAVPSESHPYWAHIVRNFRNLESHEAKAILPRATHGITFSTFIYNPNVMMKWITQRIQSLGAVLEQREVSSFDEIDADLIINCTGIAARDLANDDTVFPIRGQTVRVENPSIKRFMMAVERDGTHTYILPRPGGEIVLGGTLQRGRWDTRNDEDDVRAIWERCVELCPALKTNTEHLGQWAGLRPARRDGVRLELDPHTTRSGARVIHNYGHSGSGHTLQWGCAQDVVAIAQQHFGTSQPAHSRL